MEARILEKPGRKIDEIAPQDFISSYYRGSAFAAQTLKPSRLQRLNPLTQFVHSGFDNANYFRDH
jgi:hypothetical protein